MESAAPTFQVTDYFIFGFMLTISSCIGIYYSRVGGKQRTNKEYLLADGQMGVIPVSFSLMASFMSAITLLGVAAENYMSGTQFVVINLAYVIGTPISAYIFLPVFFRKKFASSFEYLEHRFNKITRLTACATFMLQMIMYMSIVLYAPALAFSAVTGLPKWPCVITVGFVCTFYSTIGGIKAVLWTDVFQSLLMFSAIFSIIIKGVMDVGSFTEVWNIAEQGNRIEFLNFNPDMTVRHTVWSLVIGGIFLYASIYGVNQAQVQRLLTTGNLKKAQVALFLNLPITSFLSITTSLAGIVMYANFYNCDPMLQPHLTNVTKRDQLLPYFVMKSLGSLPGLPGLFLAGIFSGALSTMSSAINSLAAVTFEDFVSLVCFRKASDMQKVTITKIIAFFYGCLCIALTYFVERFGGILEASLVIFNVMGGPLLGLFSLGMLCHCAKSKGSLVGFLAALAVCSWIGFGARYANVRSPTLRQSVSGCPVNTSLYQGNFSTIDATIEDITTEFVNSTTFLNINETTRQEESWVFPLYQLSYMWYSALGWTLTVTLGLVLSLLESGRHTDFDSDLLSPFALKFSKKRGYTFETIPMSSSPCPP